MFSRRPGMRFNRGRVSAGRAAPGGGGGGPSSLLGLEVAADGYSIVATYDGTPPTDGNYAVGGDTPEYIVSTTTGATTRTWQLSGPVLDTETVTLSSDTLTAEAVTNNSTEAGADYRTGLLVELDARTGMTHTGDGTQVTAWADQSGNGYNFGPIDSGLGGTYEDAHAPFNGQPALRHGTTLGTQQSTAAGLCAALAGQGKPCTVVSLISMGSNIASMHSQLSYGLKNNGTNHYNHMGLVGGTSQWRTQGTGNITRTHNNADEWQHMPGFALMTAGRYTGNATVEILRANGQALTLDNSAFVMGSALSVDTVALNARLAAVAYALGGPFHTGKWRLYDHALTDAQLRQVGRIMAEDYKTWGFGCSPARALAA